MFKEVKFSVNLVKVRGSVTRTWSGRQRKTYRQLSQKYRLLCKKVVCFKGAVYDLIPIHMGNKVVWDVFVT